MKHRIAKLNEKGQGTIEKWEYHSEVPTNRDKRKIRVLFL